MIKKPPYRKLRGYAFDPSLSLNIDTALINNITYRIPWEDEATDEGRGLSPGPCGEYIEVIDFDPTVKKFYAPVDLSDPYILAQDGLEPSGANPQFHQQMVYAVAMTTIKHFEEALGRPVLWAPRRIRVPVEEKKGTTKKKSSSTPADTRVTDKYVARLRIYPHALRDANAFYSPQKKSLLFGYFSAKPADVTLQMPDSLTFTCLSHDIIAHETTHAILDGLYRKYIDDTNPDVLAFHEAFADVVALFQHFSFPNVLINQIAATRGDLAAQNLLGKLAQEFGIAIGSYGALRDAIGEFDPETKQWKPKEPNGDEYRTIMEPHARGAILVSAIFDAFLTIYKSRVADLLRIATNGTGVLPQGQLQPDLVNRLAAEAAKTASHVLNMCIRALDYCPPLDITFGDFLRAVITADGDLVADDSRDYRIAFIDAFRKRGIYPMGVKNLSVESLSYAPPKVGDMQEQIKILADFLRDFRTAITYVTDREEIFNLNRQYIAGEFREGKRTIFGLHRRLHVKFRNSAGFEKLTGLTFSDDFEKLGIRGSTAYGAATARPSFEVHSLHYASRVGPDGGQTNQVIVTLIQRASLSLTQDKNGNWQAKTDKSGKSFEFAGGCTLIFDLDTLQLKYAISKPLIDTEILSAKGQHQLNMARLTMLYSHQHPTPFSLSPYQAYFGATGKNRMAEPFAFLHTH